MEIPVQVLFWRGVPVQRNLNRDIPVHNIQAVAILQYKISNHEGNPEPNKYQKGNSGKSIILEGCSRTKETPVEIFQYTIFSKDFPERNKYQ